mgnify:CR=1 FL=1
MRPGPAGDRVAAARVLDEEMSAAYLGHGLEITSSDVVQAFLQADLKEGPDAVLKDI